ncbi:hypothetical protein OG21DRAFT_1603326 [Imleria badia]|nr:hypothetical protein OG21DRAFT_1603326 [Imleria badia]
MWILEDADPTGFQQCSLTQPLSLEQWKLIQKYTPRVTAISLHSDSTSSTNRLQAIAAHWPPSFEPLPTLFPKLKAICGASPGPDNLALFYWLNGPSLTHLEIPSLAGDLASQTLIDFVSDMGTIYPNMKTLDLNASLDYRTPDAMIRAFSKSTRSWKHLVHVSLDTVDLDTAAYEHLMRLESLTHLTLMLVYDCLPRLRLAVLPQKPFPMLTDLTLVDHDYHIPRMVEWLSCLHLPPSSLTCETGGYFADAQQISDLCHAIAAQFCHKSLETIMLMDYDNTTSCKY